MTQAKAKEFVEKLFNDDEFAIKFIEERGVFEKPAVSTDEKEYIEIAKYAKKLGYDFTPEEYKAANDAYFDTLGPMKSIKKAFHIVSLARKVKKAKK